MDEDENEDEEDESWTSSPRRSSIRYIPDGKLATRTWARGVTTTSAYDPSGSLTNIVYSDTTPDVSFQYDLLGRQKVAQTFLSAYHFAYDGIDLVSETVVDPQTGASNVITRSSDALSETSRLQPAQKH